MTKIDFKARAKNFEENFLHFFPNYYDNDLYWNSLLNKYNISINLIETNLIQVYTEFDNKSYTYSIRKGNNEFKTIYYNLSQYGTFKPSMRDLLQSLQKVELSDYDKFMIDYLPNKYYCDLIIHKLVTKNELYRIKSLEYNNVINIFKKLTKKLPIF
jgi:hypothetical protein